MRNTRSVFRRSTLTGAGASAALLAPLALAAAIVTASCDGSTSELAAPDGEVPLVPHDGGHTVDRADRACAIVLRELTRLPQPASEDNGEAQPDGGPQSWDVVATIDVARRWLDAGGLPFLLVHSDVDDAWQEVPAGPASHAMAQASLPGFGRFIAKLSVPAGATRPAQPDETARIEAVPFLRLPDGTRLFDHNRNPGVLDNYVLSAENEFHVLDDPATCGALEVAWAGDWGSGLRSWGAEKDSCAAPALGLSEPVALPESRLRDLPCAIVSARVRVPGLTDVGGDPARLLAEVEWSVDGGPERRTSLRHAGGSGGVWVYVWDLAHEAFGSGFRRVDFAFRFSAGGPWYRIGLGQGPSGGDARTLQVLDPPGTVSRFLVSISEDALPCESGTPLEHGFLFGPYARDVATVRSLCFDVWKEGVTDWDNPDLWREIDVALYHRFGEGPWFRTPVPFHHRVGASARYVFDLASIDPFRPLHCPDVEAALTAGTDGFFLDARVEMFVTVGGVRIPASGAFSGTYEDRAYDPWREQNCPGSPGD